MSLTLDDIIAIPDVDVHVIPCPTWKRDVFMRAPSAGRRDRFDSSIFDPETNEADRTLFRCRIVALCLCDEEGKFLCDDPIGGAVLLADKASTAISELFDSAMQLAGLQKTEDAVKN